MPSKDEVEFYLNDLKSKLSVFEMVIIERKKNQDTLAALEVVNSKEFCISEINKLTAKNYFRGPTADTQNSGEYWEFGTFISGDEIYIKVNKGKFNKSCLLISFHFKEFEISYPFS